ncbi:MAG: hypothetical protein QOC89_2774 [Paraburkholderia sp.]|nr:hypothetical protein [Paraburkholderia sp.]
MSSRHVCSRITPGCVETERDGPLAGNTRSISTSRHRLLHRACPYARERRQQARSGLIVAAAFVPAIPRRTSWQPNRNRNRTHHRNHRDKVPNRAGPHRVNRRQTRAHSKPTCQKQMTKARPYAKRTFAKTTCRKEEHPSLTGSPSCNGSAPGRSRRAQQSARLRSCTDEANGTQSRTPPRWRVRLRPSSRRKLKGTPEARQWPRS